MGVRHFVTGCAALALAVGVAPQPGQASDALVGGIVGGVIGGVVSGAIQRDQQQRRAATQPRTQPRTVQRSAVPSATRTANREMQASLNYFGFPAGTVDGIVGRNTRNAVSQFQAFMGYPVTGQLTEFERSFLVGSYHRAQAGGMLTAQAIAANPQGPRGLLLQYRDEMARGTTMVAAPPALPQVAPEAAPQMAAVPQAAEPAPQPAPVAAAPEPELAAPAPALPNFLGAAPVQASLSSHCNRVSLETNSNGGFTTLASMTDPAFVLEEQFCLARVYAIADGEEMAARVPGQTPAQIAEQCAGLGAAMQPQVAGLAATSAADAMREVSAFVAGTGMAPVQLAGTGRICLSSGYRSDDMAVALGSALLLVTVGERVYGELIGHHLAQGFGVPARPDLALEWYDMAVSAMAAGARTPFLPGQPERIQLIEAASAAVGGRVELAPPARETPIPAALPQFAVPEVKDTKPAP